MLSIKIQRKALDVTFPLHVALDKEGAHGNLMPQHKAQKQKNAKSKTTESKTNKIIHQLLQSNAPDALATLLKTQYLYQNYFLSFTNVCACGNKAFIWQISY